MDLKFADEIVLQSNWTKGLLNFAVPDIKSEVEAAMQAFKTKDWGGSGKLFINIYRQLEDLREIEGLYNANLGLGEGSQGVGAFVESLGEHYYKRGQILKEWALRVLHDAAIAFFAHRGEEPPDNSVITAHKKYKATLKTIQSCCT